MINISFKNLVGIFIWAFPDQIFHKFIATKTVDEGFVRAAETLVDVYASQKLGKSLAVLICSLVSTEFIHGSNKYNT